ncbi:MAG: peptidylprolyl isomerase [Oscillospiraceae bacterium]|nr:peptidylprolyl isomerase [Oscillospiraceae bacterium]
MDPKTKRKQQRKAESASPVNRILAIVVSALLALGVTVFILNVAAVPHRTLTALTVGDVKVTAAEYNVYFGDVYSNIIEMYEYYGIDTSTLTEDYFREQAEAQIQSTVLLADEARKNNLVLSEENRATLDSALAEVDSAAATEKTSANKLLSDAYGQGVTRAVYAKVVEDRALASQWSTEKPASYEYTQTDLDTYYEENPLSVDLFTFRAFTIAADAPVIEEGETEATEEAAQAVLDEAKAKADKFLSEITTEASFNELAATYAPEESASTYTDDPDATLVQSTSISDYAEVERNWLSDAARKTGDKTVLDTASDTGYIIYYFIKQEHPDADTVDVRHILALFKDETGAQVEEPTDEQKEAAKTLAQGILDEWNAGAKTEDSFAELAREKTDDSNGAQGGLYENVGPHTGFVEPFRDWSVDSARQPGDTALVETVYGYHVMYFVRKTGEAEWVVTVDGLMRERDFAAYTTALNEANPIVKNDFGMSFTLKFKT